MARVIMPLLGVEAMGKIGNAIVYMPIPHAKHGLTSVRVWTVPKNPKSEDQGDVRQYVKLGGYGLKFMKTAGTFIDEIKAVTPATQIWNAYFLKQMFGDGFLNMTTSLASFAAIGATRSADWDTIAASLGMVAQSITYASIEATPPGAICFVHARAAFDLDIAPATVDAQLMSKADIQLFGSYYSLL